MHTEVTNLPNLSGYLRFGRDLPVVRFADRYNDLPSIGEAFTERRRLPHRIAPLPAPPSPSGSVEAAPSSAKPAKNGAPARKRSGKREANANAPELKLDLPMGASDPAPEDTNGEAPTDRDAPADGSPDNPATPLEIIAPHWDRTLRQHGRPGGRRRPAKPA
jgi:hypothetical protein